jgi:hypothetical protein
MMKAISVLQEGTQWTHEFLEMVMVDVTPEQAHWRPLGIANPLGQSMRMQSWQKTA